jgi:hypothetical protein
MLLRQLEGLIETDGSVQEAILAVNVKMNKISVFHYLIPISNAKIQMSNQCQIPKCQKRLYDPFDYLSFEFVLNFEL